MASRSEIAIPPHDIASERAVLGLALLDPPSFESICARLDVEDFYLESHRVVFRALVLLHEGGQGIDELTLHHALAEAGELELAGGPAGIALLIEQACIAAYLEDYIRIVLQQSGKRQQIQALERALERARNGTSPADLAQETADALAKIAERTDPEAAQERSAKVGTVVPLGTVVEETMLDVFFGAPDLIPSPIPYLNERFGGGFRRGEYIVLGGGPGDAKTALATEWGRFASHPENGSHRVLMISLEMDRVALGGRILSQAAMVSASSIRKHELREDERTRIERIIPQLGDLQLAICDDVTSISQLVRLVKSAARAEQDIRLLIVDYLQLVQGPTSITDRRLEVRYVSATLKRLAKRYHMTVLALSSMTPGPNERGKRGRPTMRHLRETRDIDHDADVILLLWKPDAEKSERELIIDKARSGETGSCRLAFTPWYLTFQEEPES